jgi:hypothetical protein
MSGNAGTFRFLPGLMNNYFFLKEPLKLRETYPDPKVKKKAEDLFLKFAFWEKHFIFIRIGKLQEDLG